MADYRTDEAERKMWQACMAGDEEAFAHLFYRHHKKLCNYGYKIIPDKDLIQDCVQELFITLWHNRQKLVYTDGIYFYLIKSLRGKLLRLLKKQKKFSLQPLPPDFAPVEFTFSPEDGLILDESQQEQQDQLLKALNALPSRQKEILYLKFFNNLSYLEIAELLSVNYQVVRNYAYKAIKSLRQKTELLAKLWLLWQLPQEW
jgi:RNA polymerase sigma factor (sigma-70 family)